MTEIQITDLEKTAEALKAGDEIALTGTVYTSRDAAHKRIFAALDSGKKLPFDIAGSVIYYCGPTQSVPPSVIGSCGPTTASRMDIYAPRLYDMGMLATIGKGNRSEEVRQAIVRRGGLYLCAVGGLGALLSSKITSCEVIAYGDLGCESVKRLSVASLPLYVGIDSYGNTIFDR